MIAPKQILGWQKILGAEVKKFWGPSMENHSMDIFTSPDRLQ